MRTILVTGHSKGIGYAITDALLQSGHRVVGVSRTLVDERMHLVQHACDLSEPNEVEHCANDLIKLLRTSESNASRRTANAHPIDAVVCNAGAGRFGALENFSATQIQQSIQLNLVSPLILLKVLLPGLKQHSRSDIIFIASESALQGGRFGSIYSAAKFGIRGVAQSLRHECAATNCHVGVVNPGMVRTGFFDDLSFEPGNAEQHALGASDVAQAVMNILDSPDNAVIEEINVNPLQHVVQKKS